MENDSPCARSGIILFLVYVAYPKILGIKGFVVVIFKNFDLKISSQDKSLLFSLRLYCILEKKII